MSLLYFVTHPEVDIDPAVPVPRWHLSDRGIARMRSFARSDALRHLSAVWASTETKAIEAAGLLAAAHGLPVCVDEGLRENDRSATGFLPPAAFEQMADAFFAEPQASVRGWERAVDAQARVTAAIERVLSAHTKGDVAVVAHGGVGTLLLCRCLGVPISRSLDQPFQGHFWTLDRDTRSIVHGWRPIAPRQQS